MRPKLPTVGPGMADLSFRALGGLAKVKLSRILGTVMMTSLLAPLTACRDLPDYEDPTKVDVVIRNGLLYDGSGDPPRRGDVAISGDRIVAVGSFSNVRGRREIDATGLAVAPGFINMLSWATESLIEDGRSQSDIRQGVTLEVFGEGWSMGPINESMRKGMIDQQGDIRFDVTWTTLGEYLEYLVSRGVSPNVASFVGATTVRIHEVGYENRPPTEAELERMKLLVQDAMEEGALGLGSSLIYAPAFYAQTDELIELARVAGKYGGMYISHLRSEADRLLESVDELIEIARAGDLPAEIYHLKAAGRKNWGKLEELIEKVEAAREEGLRITTDMYAYTAGATGLDAAMPPWVQEGGHDQWVKNLKDPAIRARVLEEMARPGDDWENLYDLSGPESMLLVGFKNDALKPLTGMTLTAVAKERGKSTAETAIDLVIEDDSRVGTIYFLMSEDNVKRKIGLPWMSFCSDAGSLSPAHPFSRSNPHPRAYGNFARVLGKYVRDQGAAPLEDVIRRLTSFPAANLGIEKRGSLKPSYFGDVVVFDPGKIQDHSEFATPHRYSTGVVHVFVNGEQVLRYGEHTGATPGQVVRGPGWKGKKSHADDWSFSSSR